ncbi:MAG TPA: cytochrome c biogenesis protein ResB, partial [Patescibacteria group bacterium]|nr:cytochrome c biogenesis protein ResB [Patescibacteria group bacterium]
MKNKRLIQRFRFLRSMGFGVFLLVFILILSVIGTILPQNQGVQLYVEGYSEYIAEFILVLGLDHIYSS